MPETLWFLTKSLMCVYDLNGSYVIVSPLLLFLINYSFTLPFLNE